MLKITKITDQKHFIIDSAVSFGIICTLLYFIGIEDILREFSNINYTYLLCSIVFLILMYFGMTARIYFILSKLHTKAENDSLINRMKFRDLFKMHMVGMLLADFTPARSGYLAVAYGLTKKYNISEEKSVIAILGPQIYDFTLKVIIGTIGIFYLINIYLKIQHAELLFLGTIIIACMIAIMIFLLFSKKFLHFFSFAKKIPVADKILSILEKAQQNSNVIIHEFPVLFFLLIFGWSMKAISWFFVAKALDITLTIDFPQVFAYFFLQPILTTLEFVPSPTLAGLGLSEGGGILVFSIFGISAAKAASFIFLARMKTIIVNVFAIKETLSLIRS
ncbi:MAG: lysylphosphatidylglycerol synthase transmembrane domain-containing protein [Candidatus Micrarchaeota archaeon]